VRTLASARRWPPDYLDELADLLIQVPYPHIKPSRRRDTEFGLLTGLAEIQAWLEAWPNDQQLASDTQSMVDDLARAFAGAGAKVCSRTPSAAALQQAIRTVVAAGGQADTRPLSIHLATLHAELTDPETTLAAFDDLVATVRDPDNSHLVVQTRLSVLTEILDLTDRPVAEICRILGGIVDDQALEISIARHGLDGTPILNVDRPDEQAGLSVEDRLELSRRYLSIPARPGRHLVWVAYGDAHLAGEGPRVEVGPVEFFDGPALLEAIAEGEVSPHRLPEELLDPRGPGGRDLDLWPTGEEIRRWVAARVDLGTGQFSDPIRIGRAQADAIVQLAAFENDESTRQPSPVSCTSSTAVTTARNASVWPTTSMTSLSTGTRLPASSPRSPPR
jgi:hypothetical protein